MTQATASPGSPGQLATGLVRVTVASGSRRVDLVLPSAIPLAELVPELARSVGLLDAATVFGGYQVVAHDGRTLVPGSGLSAQGVEDGAVLTVTAGVDAEPPRVYDDVVEAMTDVVERDLAPWSPEAGRRTALGAAGLLMALGALALLAERGSDLAAVAASVVALCLLAGSVVLSRAQQEDDVAIAVAWMSAGYAAVAGLLFLPDGLAGYPVAAAGVGAVTSGLAAMLGVATRRPLLLPPVVAGGVLIISGLLMHLDFARPAGVLTAALTVLVLIGSVLPWLALRFTATDVDQLFSLADVTAAEETDDVDAIRVRTDARIAHEILVGVSAAVGVILVIAAPLAVTLGVTGTLVAVLSCVIVMIRTRQYRTGTQVLVGLVSGLAGLISTAIALLVVQPDWRPGTAVVLAVVGAVLLASTLVPQAPSVRRGRLGDLAESASLIALLPLTLVAVGVFARVAG